MPLLLTDWHGDHFGGEKRKMAKLFLTPSARERF